jgi:hypothetical protein
MNHVDQTKLSLPEFLLKKQVIQSDVFILLLVLIGLHDFSLLGDFLVELDGL